MMLEATLTALADPTRRAILSRLAQGEARVTEVAKPFAISLNSVSKHIRMLERADLLRRRVEGRDHILSLNPPASTRPPAGSTNSARSGPGASASSTRPSRFRPMPEDTQKTATVTATHRYDAPPERVFDAWLDPALAAKFFFATPTGQMIRAEVDARVGGRFTFVDRRPDMGPNGADVLHTGEYLELDRPRRLAFTFGVPQFNPDFTRVLVELAPTPAGGCYLTLTHEGVFESEWANRSKHGLGHDPGRAGDGAGLRRRAAWPSAACTPRRRCSPAWPSGRPPVRAAPRPSDRRRRSRRGRTAGSTPARRS